MKILFKNARIITLKNKNIFKGDLLVDGNRIADIKKCINVKADRVINCGGNVLMPGFKNAHAHSAMTFARSFADDLPLESWLSDCIFPLEDNLTKHDVYALSKVAYLEYLTSGITACFDMYFYPPMNKKAADEFGFRTVALKMPKYAKESLDEARRTIKKSFESEDLARYALGVHAYYTASKDQIKAVADFAHEFKLPVYVHCAESKAEFDNCIKEHKLTPLQYLNKFKLFDYGGGIYHGVYLTKKDIKILKEKKLYVCTCPASNLKLASGIAPIRELFDAKIPIAIGTDGPASNNALDMFREMYLVSVLSKYRENDPADIDAFEILKMACSNGAKMMHIKDADVLAKDKLADIIMIDVNQPSMQPINNIIKNIVYSGSKLDVKMTMIDGKILYYNNKFYIKEKPSDIYKEADKCTKRLIRLSKRKKTK